MIRKHSEWKQSIEVEYRFIRMRLQFAWKQCMKRAYVNAGFSFGAPVNLLRCSVVLFLLVVEIFGLIHVIGFFLHLRDICSNWARILDRIFAKKSWLLCRCFLSSLFKGLFFFNDLVIIGCRLLKFVFDGILFVQVIVEYRVSQVVKSRILTVSSCLFFSFGTLFAHWLSHGEQVIAGQLVKHVCLVHHDGLFTFGVWI